MVNRIYNGSKLTVVLAFLLAALPFSAYAIPADVTVHSSVNKKSILIGDRISYTIEVRSSVAIDVDFPKFKDGKIGDFEIKDTARKYRKGLFGNNIYQCIYEITTYSVGEEVIPASDFRYKEKSKADWKSGKTESLSVKVSSVLPADGSARDIKDIKGPAFFYSVNMMIVAGAALALTLIILSAILIYALLFRPKPPMPPYERALLELEKARGSLANNGNVKEYYVGVSDSVRRYIEDVFILKAPEMTTEEFLSSIGGAASLSIRHKELLKEFMGACDMVKFAKYIPAQTEVESLMNTAKNFLDETGRPSGKTGGAA